MLSIKNRDGNRQKANILITSWVSPYPLLDTNCSESSSFVGSLAPSCSLSKLTIWPRDHELRKYLSQKVYSRYLEFQSTQCFNDLKI